MCLVGEVSFGVVSGRGNLRRGCAWLGKCSSRVCLVGEVSIGHVSGWGNVCRGSVCREESVGEMSVWDMSDKNSFFKDLF